jgi:hypothetical protein
MLWERTAPWKPMSSLTTREGLPDLILKDLEFVKRG